MNETLFQAAGENLFNGDLDPRLLIRYFPDLRGSLFMADDVAEVFAGVAEYMPVEDSVDDMSESFLDFLAPPNSSSCPRAVSSYPAHVSIASIDLRTFPFHNVAP